MLLELRGEPANAPETMGSAAEMMRRDAKAGDGALHAGAAAG